MAGAHPACATLAAQTKLTAAIGAAIPIGVTADRMRIGYASALAVSLTSPRSPHRIRLEVAIADLSDKTPTRAPVERRLTLGTANVVAAPVAAPGVPSGYVIAGIGAYHQRAAGKGSDSAGLNVGAGISFAFGPFGAFTEARLHYLTDGARTKLFPLTFGLVF